MNELYKGLLIFILIVLFSIITIQFGFDFYKSHYKSKECKLDIVTVYNPTKNQCDDTPLITANNSIIDMKNFPDNWIALSQDLIKSGEFKYGDSIIVILTDSIPKIFIVMDTKNKRYNNQGDILCKSRKYGLWKNVKIRKL